MAVNAVRFLVDLYDAWGEPVPARRDRMADKAQGAVPPQSRGPESRETAPSRSRGIVARTRARPFEQERLDSHPHPGYADARHLRRTTKGMKAFDRKRCWAHIRRSRL